MFLKKRFITKKTNHSNDQLRYSIAFFEISLHQFIYFQVVHRPVVRETIFLPDRKAPPLIPVRDAYVVSLNSRIKLMYY